MAEDLSVYLKKTPEEHIREEASMYVGGMTSVSQNFPVLDFVSAVVPTEAAEAGVCVVDEDTEDAMDAEEAHEAVDAEEAHEAVDDSAKGVNDGSWRFSFRTVQVVPGLLQCIEELLLNAADSYTREAGAEGGTTSVRVGLFPTHVTVQNNGHGIPVAESPNVPGELIPDFIFSVPFSGSSYVREGKGKFTGGRYGIGAKAANIFSTRFEVDIVDDVRHKSFKKVWLNGMRTSSVAKVRDVPESRKGYTKITFHPNFAIFGVDCLTPDHLSVLRARLYALSATSEIPSMWLCGDHPAHKIPVRSFRSFAKLVAPSAPFVKLDGWEIACYAAERPRHLSFVNNIFTRMDGNHVYMVTHAMHGVLDQKKTNPLSRVLNSNLCVVVKTTLPNPEFNSQQKERLTSACKNLALPESFVQNVARLLRPFSDARVSRENTSILRASDGSTRRPVVPKLEDAEWAGGKHGHECHLFLTEGDSAKALVICGFSVVDRRKFGVFPLRGKPLNVADASSKKLASAEEFKAIKAILGLKQDRTYEKDVEFSTLRYGHVVAMCDADEDGAHIVGLLFNMFQRFWPCLLKRKGFFRIFCTDLIRATRGSTVVGFSTQSEFDVWRADHPEKGWAIKYYKGLGTSTADDARRYFRDIDQHMVDILVDEETQSLIELAFDKKAANKRRDWLQTPPASMNPRLPVTVSTFVHGPLKEYSEGANHRAIPSVVDGLKPAERKILFVMLADNIVADEKVAQLGGLVARKTHYHHGEQSLTATITGMAQDFVGSNNVPLLVPSGQFGTRLAGGDDAASARYIFTHLQPYTRLIFPKADDNLLQREVEEDNEVEPKFFVPILPMLLVNGAKGIGTGWATTIPPHSVEDVFSVTRAMIQGLPTSDPHIGTRGWRGTVEMLAEKAVLHGVREDDEVTELPIGTWNSTFRAMLEKKDISYTDHSTDTAVHIKIHEESNWDEIPLDDSISLRNMVAWLPSGILHRYDSAMSILHDWFGIRRELYVRRREAILQEEERKMAVNSNQLRFVKEVAVEKTLVVWGRPRDDIEAEMMAKKYVNPRDLLSIPLAHLSKEEVERMEREMSERARKLHDLRVTPVEKWVKDTWLSELRVLESVLVAVQKESTEPPAKKRRTAEK